MESLSDEAKRMLRAADKEETSVQYGPVEGHIHIMIDGVDAFDMFNNRERQRWVVALDQLVNQRLVVPLGESGTLTLTSAGYARAAELDAAK